MKSKKRRSRSQRGQQFQSRRYRNARPHSLPAESHSFVGMAREGAAMPLHVKGGGKSVKEVAVENPLSRGGHTQVAVVGAFFKKRWHAWWLCPFWT